MVMAAGANLALWGMVEASGAPSAEDDPVYVIYDGQDRFLVDDIVDFVGLSSDLITYESVMGGEITIPSVYVIEENGMRLAP
jgi:hypothetical protein